MSYLGEVFAYLRQRVGDQLLDVRGRPPGGLRLPVVERYRPPARTNHFERHSQSLRGAHPQ
ncbi:hypothetical protein [Streptomyces pratensis]|uniref:hypothetical protein n=1 Tax=Streptomyces pratensis TaxID=1169025 RepID=UPI001931B7BB|nr:hypothetical protein [Streptomyces pratensis]